MTSHYDDDYGYQPERDQKRYGLYFIVGLLFCVGIMALTYYADFSPASRATINAASWVLILLTWVMDAKRLFDPALKKANDNQRNEDRKSLSKERFFSLFFIAIFLLLAIFQIGEAISHQAYTQPWFFAAPGAVLIVAGLFLQNEPERQTTFDREWGIEGHITRAAFWWNLGTAMIAGGVIITVLGCFNLWSAA